MRIIINYSQISRWVFIISFPMRIPEIIVPTEWIIDGPKLKVRGSWNILPQEIMILSSPRFQRITVKYLLLWKYSGYPHCEIRKTIVLLVWLVLFNLGKNKTKLGKQVFMHTSLSIAGCKSYACKWTDLSLYDFQFKAVEQLLSIEDQLAEPSQRLRFVMPCLCFWVATQWQ